MKGRRTARLLGVLVIGALFYAAAHAMKVQAEEDPYSPTPGSQTGSASELSKHNSAFALLLETYRQFQNNLIQIDYSNRLNAAASLTGIETRKEVITLATQERDLRLRKLAAQLAIFTAAYGHFPQDDEQVAGVAARNGVDTKAAARKLRNFVVFAPATNSSPVADAVQTFPASAVLLNEYPNP
jgi:hypothetical protein